MKKLSVILIFCLPFFSYGFFFPASAWPQTAACGNFSDDFDSYDLEKWREVLLYSQARGRVTVESSQLLLAALEQEPSEIQVYSLFVFEGDFDVQVDYRLSSLELTGDCRLNAGMVFQTIGDERSYKAYVTKQGTGDNFSYSSRQDRFGEENLEKHKTSGAAADGTLRIVRKNGIITYMNLKGENWNTIYTFDEPFEGKLRMRFKLQTGDEDLEGSACPAVVRFDTFKINECYRIIPE